MSCKTKYKKQHLATGGLVFDFDYNSLSPEQKTYYDSLDTVQQQNFRNEISKKNTSQQSSSSSTDIGGLIGMIQGVASAVGGEEDEKGQSDSQVQAVFEGIGDIGSAPEAAAYYADEGNYAYALGSMMLPGFSEIQLQSDQAKDYKKKQQEQMLLSAAMNKQQQQSFKNGGPVKDTKERDTGKLNLSEEEQLKLYGEDEGIKPLYTSDEIIHGMIQKGYSPFPENREDRIQDKYSLSQSEKDLYDTFETKDVQKYLTEELGIDLDDFGVDNVFGKETGEVLSKYIETKGSPDKLSPRQPKISEYTKDPVIKKKDQFDRILYYGPEGQIYQANPNTFGNKGAEKNFTVSSERETLQYLTEVAGMDYEAAKELSKTEEGRQELVNYFNKKQGYSDNLIKAYVNQGNFPVYKDNKLQGMQRIYDDEGNLIIKDTSSLKYSEGGTIVGKGTSKSDSINANLSPGDFIIPDDSPVSKNAINRMMKILELDHTAEVKNQGTESVKVSNKEKVIPREKVMQADQILKSMGYNQGLQEAAPNAEYDFLNYQNIV